MPGRDLGAIVEGRSAPESIESPIYFMTEDDISPPINIESVVATLPTGQGGARELWKMNHYYERLDNWYAAQGIASNPFLPTAAEPEWELHNLTVDPEERHNLAFDDYAALSSMRSVLETERDTKRLIPKLRNASP